MGRELAIVIPYFAGTETIRTVINDASTACHVAGLKHRIIVVDDSGKPESEIELKELLNGTENVQVINLLTNLGQHNATFIGILMAKGSDVITIDDDLRFPCEMIPRIVDQARTRNVEVLYAIQPREGFSGMMREGLLGMVKPLLANNYPSRTSSFRFIRADVAERMTSAIPKFVQLEGLILHHANSFAYLDIPKERLITDSGYSLFSLFRMFTGLINHYSMIPLVLISMIIMAVNALMIANKIAAGYWMLPFGGLAIIVLWAERQNKKQRKALIRQLKVLNLAS